jgi:hypothetical protein
MAVDAVSADSRAESPEARPDARPESGPDSPSTPTRVFVHIGEPKTGTTFLQQVMWGNRGELAARGLALPGHHPQDHYRASQDLRGIEKLPSDPAAPWTGEWDILATEAKASRLAVISHELFSAADPAQAERAVRSLEPAEVHVVLTVRDMGSLLPAEWQETIKHRNTRAWEDWLADVIDVESRAQDRDQYWFWKVHDSVALLARWAAHVPPERLHVITMPQRGADDGLLWERFAGVLGIDPGGVDLAKARSNSSLGMPEIEFLRHLNEALPEEVPGWYYMQAVKETVAHRALALRPRQGRLVLPADRDAWAAEQAETLISGLTAAGYDIVGDPGELRPQPITGPRPSPSSESAEQVLDAAVAASAALVVAQFRRAHPAARPQSGPARPRGLVSRVESSVAGSPKVKNTVRELSRRYPAMRRLRVLAWREMERRRARARGSH